MGRVDAHIKFCQDIEKQNEKFENIEEFNKELKYENHKLKEKLEKYKILKEEFDHKTKIQDKTISLN